jgi:AraC-like DNA-binding protein
MDGSRKRNIEFNCAYGKLLPTSQFICDAFSRVSEIAQQKFEFSFPDTIGQGGFRQISTRKNIIISEYKMGFHCNMDVIGINKSSYIDLCFCLEDGVEWEIQSGHKKLQINKGETFISNNRHGIERTCYHKDRKFNFIGIKIPVTQFRKIIEDYADGSNYLVLENKIGCFLKFSITPSVRIVLQQLLNCPYQNTLQEMYTQGKLLELLSVYFSEAILQKDMEKDRTIGLSRSDRDSILNAKEILDRSLSNPPSCASLSRMVFLSESKLTRGFKELFGMPVYTYVIDKRLETALFLFESGETQVSSVASMVGYGNMSHFSAAFRKKYGINPSEYIKKYNK